MENFTEVCERRCLKINVIKSKVILVEREGETGCNCKWMVRVHRIGGRI